MKTSRPTKRTSTLRVRHHCGETIGRVQRVPELTGLRQRPGTAGYELLREMNVGGAAASGIAVADRVDPHDAPKDSVDIWRTDLVVVRFRPCPRCQTGPIQVTVGLLRQLVASTSGRFITLPRPTRST